ncbi:MAG: CHAT domain-containing protein, partial [Acidobacteria bacterium]
MAWSALVPVGPERVTLRAVRWIALAALLLAPGCGGSDSPAPAGRSQEGGLEACREGDAPWREAVARAEADRSLGELAERLERVAPRCPGRWEPVWARAECLLRGGSTGEAAPLYRKALDLARRADDPVGVARAADGVAWTAYARGDIDEGERFYREAIEAARRAGRQDLEAFSLANLAGLLVERGDLARARDALASAAPILERLGRPDAARRLAYNRASLLLDLGDAEAARQVLERLYQEGRREGDVQTAAFAALALGNLHRQRGDAAEALQWLSRVGSADPQAAALAALQRGRVRLARGELEAAREDFARARELAQRGGYPVVALFAEVYDAARLARVGEPERAAAELDALARRASRERLWWPHWVARWQQGRALIEAGRVRAAVAALREAVARLEEAGRGLDPLGEGLRFLLERHEPYADLAWALAAGHAPVSEVLRVVESAHARALRRIAGAGDPLAAPDLPGIERALRPGEALATFLLGREHSVAVVIAPDSARAVLLAGRRRLDSLLRRFRAALRAPLLSVEARLDPERALARAREAGARLRALVFDPLEPAFSGARRVYLVPDGPLALLPFAALPDEERGDGSAFLGDRLLFARLPHAGAPARIDVRGPVLLAGAPLPDPGGRYGPLPRASWELERLRETWGDEAEILRGAELDRAHFLARDLGRFSLVHLATHAEAGTRDPQRSALVLSRGERLDLEALAQLRLAGALVVLSACRTGEGELVPGEGIFGLSWALLRAGAAGVVASLWSVEDDSAAELMASFHRRLAAREDPVAALAGAAREAHRRRPHPAYWAPFVITLRAATGPG